MQSAMQNPRQRSLGEGSTGPDMSELHRKKNQSTTKKKKLLSGHFSLCAKVWLQLWSKKAAKDTSEKCEWTAV